MARVSYETMYNALYKAGFRGPAIPTMIAIGMAESGGDPTVVGDRDIGGSYGIWQIYQPVWASKFPVSCATDVECSAKAAFEISGQGTNFNPWSVYRFSDVGRDALAGYANPFTTKLPDVVKWLNSAKGLNLPFDYSQLWKQPAAVWDAIGGVLEGATGVIDDIGGVITDPVGTITDPFLDYLPTMEEIRLGIVVGAALLVGVGMIFIGAGGIVKGSGAAQTAVRAGAAVATRGASELGRAASGK